ncbi:acetyltransferase [Pannus brasiliensis CCIBt3594]|uniref:Acetyltransferase n=1 Tax=Pannus brasiliensis CCIBt3594 TaxID=1427578 RepID=A0AAW9R282_9CHRO
MFLKHQPSGNLVEVLNLDELIDPFLAKVEGRFHSGQEMQDPEPFTKSHLIFPSGESLPVCWLDSHYDRNSRHLSKE